MEKKELKPYSPKKNVHIHIDLKDITEKAVKQGPLAVLAGTTYGVNKNDGSPQSTSSVASGVIVAYPQCVGAATNYYLKADASFSGGTSFGFGGIQGIRIN